MSIKASSVPTNQRVSVNFLNPDNISPEEPVGFYLDGQKISCMPGYSDHWVHLLKQGCRKMLYNSYMDRIMLFMEDGGVVLWDYNINAYTNLTGDTRCPQHYIDCYFDNNHYPALVCGDKYHVFKEDGTVETKKALTETYCCAYHYGRLFDVAYDDFEQFYWTVQGMTSYDPGTGNGGFMRVPLGAGYIRRLYSLGDRIVILRDFGVNVMRGLADTRNFILDHGTVMLTEKLIENTATCTGKKIWFCTEHYLYSFDGATLTQREHGYCGDNDGVMGIDAIDARYIYLSVKKDGVNYLVRYDPMTDRFVRFAKNCKYICRTPRGLFTFRGDTVGNLAKVGEPDNLMKFKRVDFNDAKYKSLKRIVLNAEPTVKLCVALNDSVYSFDAGEYDNLNLNARSFDFSITGIGEVYGLNAVWEVFK